MQIFPSTLLGFSDIILVSKTELETLQNRVIELLEANNREVEKRRSAEQNGYKTVNLSELLIATGKDIVQKIKLLDVSDYNNGSCGDGSFDSKQKQATHIDRLTAIHIIKRDILGEK